MNTCQRLTIIDEGGGVLQCTTQTLAELIHSHDIGMLSVQISNELSIRYHHKGHPPI